MNSASLIAPCGMNCGICMAFLREKDKCLGCRAPDAGKRISVLRCKIKNCSVLQKGQAKFCFECESFPCKNLKHLDKRYRTRYGMSMIENLANVKEKGIREFTRNERVRWSCPHCGGTINVHRGYCSSCGKRKSQTNV